MAGKFRVKTEADAAAVLDELRRRGLPIPEAPANEAKIREILAQQHARQQIVTQDEAKRKALRCSRQAGKTSWIARKFTTTALRKPRAWLPYIANTRKQAKRIMWGELEALNLRYRLGGHPNLTDLTLTFPNDSQIGLYGADTEADIQQLRGKKSPLAAVDEAQSVVDRILRQLIDEVLDPATIFYDGEIIVSGTPASHCSGFFFEASHPDPRQRMPGWSMHHWTVLDNTFMPNVREWLARKRAEKGWTEDSPEYRREYLGEWVKSGESLVYRFDPARNVYRELPPGSFTWLYGLAVDLGYDDPTAIVHLQWCPELPSVFVTRVERQEGMIPEQIAQRILAVRAQHPLSFVVVDQGGGAGKMIAEEFRQRWAIECKGAEKTKKATFIELCNGDLLTAKVKIHESCVDLVDELRMLQWDADRPGKEDPRFRNDCADAFLYGYREARHYFHSAEEEKPAPGSPEALKRLEREMLEATEGRVVDEQNRRQWEW